MDFTDRGFRQPQQQTNSNPESPAPQSNSPEKKQSKFHRIKNHRLLNATYITLLFSITILIAGVALSIFLFDGNNNKEDQFVDTGKYQAVFLNGGQVYFGKITNVNREYLTLADIYYLTPNQAVQSDNKNATTNSFTLKKLGCELHRPQDAMVINQSQVVFWENLKDDSSQKTVPGLIKESSSQPQNCDQQSTESNNSASSSSSASNSNSSTKSNSADSSNSSSSSSSGQ